jgi:hypothetical protein
MSVTVKSSGDFKSVEAGTYPARSFRLIDLGTQIGEYQGKPNKAHKVLIMWELPTELIVGGELDGKPYSIGKFYTASLHEKAQLRKDLESWRGKVFTQEELEGFNLINILDKPCMLSIIHDDKGRAKISAIMKLPKGVVVPSAINPIINFDISEWDDKVFSELTDGLKEIIKKSEEVKHKGEVYDVSVEEVSDLEPF